MQADRNAIDNALLALLNSAAYTFKKPGTKHAALWPAVADADQPSFRQVFFAEEKVDDQAYGIARYTRHYTVYTYLQVDPSDETSTAVLANGVLVAFDNIMQTSPQGEKQTLGGLVVNAWIEGMTYISGGVEAQQLILEIPIKVLAGT